MFAGFYALAGEFYDYFLDHDNKEVSFLDSKALESCFVVSGLSLKDKLLGFNFESLIFLDEILDVDNLGISRSIWRIIPWHFVQLRD